LPYQSVLLLGNLPNQQQQQQQAQQQHAQQQAVQYAANRDGYNRAFSVCMSGKGYSVK